jgi:hypothetical protein
MQIGIMTLSDAQRSSAMVAISQVVRMRIGTLDTPISVDDARAIRKNIGELAYVYVALCTTREAQTMAKNRANLWNAQANELVARQVDRHE